MNQKQLDTTGKVYKLTQSIDLSGQNQSHMEVQGEVYPLLASITVPTNPLTFYLNPNQPAGSQFIAPDFVITNEGFAPIRLGIKCFEQRTDVLKDVLPDEHVDWTQLNKEESKDFALALELKASDGWLSLAEGPYYVAENFNQELGVIKGKSSVSFGFLAKYGLAFENPLNPEYVLSFVFDWY